MSNRQVFPLRVVSCQTVPLFRSLSLSDSFPCVPTVHFCLFVFFSRELADANCSDFPLGLFHVNRFHLHRSLPDCFLCERTTFPAILVEICREKGVFYQSLVAITRHSGVIFGPKPILPLNFCVSFSSRCVAC